MLTLGVYDMFWFWKCGIWVWGLSLDMWGEIWELRYVRGVHISLCLKWIWSILTLCVLVAILVERPLGVGLLGMLVLGPCDVWVFEVFVYLGLWIWTFHILFLPNGKDDDAPMAWDDGLNGLNVVPKGCFIGCVIGCVIACVPNSVMWIVVESCVDPPNGIVALICGIKLLVVDFSCPWLCLVSLFGVGFSWSVLISNTWGSLALLCNNLAKNLCGSSETISSTNHATSRSWETASISSSFMTLFMYLSKGLWGLGDSLKEKIKFMFLV